MIAWESKSPLNAKTTRTLTTTGLKDYNLTDDEQAALDGLDAVTWGTFKIEDVLVWQKNISELNPLHLDSLTVPDEKEYPFYGQATMNNGIIEYRQLKNDVLNNKSGNPTILIHSNNQNTVYLETPFYLKDGHGATSVLQSSNLDRITAQFLMSSIKKVILQKYTYNSKATKIELKSTEINLPVKSDRTPNYDYMRIVISAMQKIVIKNLVDSLDIRIEKTGEILR
jgi:Type I restriction modification DNA specificity domain